MAGTMVQTNEVPLPPLTSVNTTKIAATFTVGSQQKTQGWMGQQECIAVITQAYASYAMVSPQVSSFISEFSLPLIFLCWCYGVYFIFSSSDVVAVYTNGDSKSVLVCTT